MARAFVGRSPGDIEAILGELWRDGRWRVVPHFSLQILSGIESACWDALGKGLGVPASTFLGGRVHDEVDFMAFPQGDTAEELARDAAALAAEGHRVVYIKVGRAHRDDAEVVGAVREAIGPEPLLRVDPNEAWDVPARGRRDPAARGVRPRLGRAARRGRQRRRPRAGSRNSVETKIAADQAVHTTAELRAVLEQEAADAIVLGSHESGGLWRLAADGVPRRVVRDPDEPARLPGERDLDLRRAAGDGLPAEPDARQPGHAPPAHRAARDDSDRDHAAGASAVPTAPGLGFEIDLDAVERARERAERQGPY